MYPESCQEFNMVSLNNFADKMNKKELDITVVLMELHLNDAFFWRILNMVPLGFILGLVLFNIFINVLKDGMEEMLLKFANHIMLED